MQGCATINAQARGASPLPWDNRPLMDRLECFELLDAAIHQYAYTMPGIPHYYTLKSTWRDKDAYVAMVEFVNAHGEAGRWGRQERRYFRANGMQWWAMTQDASESTLTNRCFVNYPVGTAYDGVAATYDRKFDRKGDREAKQAMYRAIRLDPPILDIGCGTGGLLDYAGRRFGKDDWFGIDPSGAMLAACVQKHPWTYGRVLRTTLKHFVTRERFKTIVGMFGSGSYLEEADTQRITDLLAPGGIALLTYYGGESHALERYRRAGIADAEERVAGLDYPIDLAELAGFRQKRLQKGR